MPCIDRHRIWTALGAVGLAAVLAACGSAGTHGVATSSFASEAVRYADCVRAHGVPDFPDPSATGAVNLSSVPGITPQSPAYQSAVRSCARLRPGPDRGPPPMSANQRLAALAFAQCMRRHGLSTFPDPQDASPGTRTTLVLLGLQFPIGPQINPNSPAFARAAKACGFRAPPPQG